MSDSDSRIGRRLGAALLAIAVATAPVACSRRQTDPALKARSADGEVQPALDANAMGGNAMTNTTLTSPSDATSPPHP